jgi:hypothetical protein
MKRIAFLTFTLLFGSVFCFAQRGDILPVSNTVDNTLYTCNIPTGNTPIAKGLRLALLSLQGLVNRQKPGIFLSSGASSDFLLKYYAQKGYFKTKEVINDPWILLNKFKSIPKGLVVFDPAEDRKFTINIATDIAGVDDLLITSPDYIEKFTTLGLKVKTDLRHVDEMKDAASAYKWVYNHYWDRQRHNVLANVYYNEQYDFNRDYLIEFKIPAIWFPGKGDKDYFKELEDHFRNLFAITPINIPIIGFWPGTDVQTDKDSVRKTVKVGVDEFMGVGTAGQYGKFTLVSDWVGNYSYHSGIPADKSSFRQKKVRVKKFRTYNPATKYVALTMIESGDSPGYYQYAFPRTQWSDEARGTVAYNFSISPMLKYLMPGLVEYLYTSATDNEYFFSSISGMGYMYPFEEYGSKTSNPDVTLSDYYKLTWREMKKMDLDMLGLYTHPFANWSAEDNRRIQQCILPNMEGLTSIIADMGKLKGTTPANANRMLSRNVSLHKCLSRWDTADKLTSPDKPEGDSAAVEWLSNEIINNSSGGNFLHMMAYSWHYGPRRIKMVADRLKNKGFEFVTLNEFEYLYRQSLLKTQK